MAPAPRIVVADDSPFMRTVLGGALGAAGFDVVGTARDGDEALAQCRATRPDAMTLDLAMPGLDGLGVLRALKENGAPDVLSIAVDIVKQAISEATANPLATPSRRMAKSVGPTRSRVRTRRTRYSQG